MSDRNLGKLIEVQNVMVTITGLVGSGRSQVLNVIKEALKETGASLIECAEHSIIVNYQSPIVHVHTNK